MDNPVQSLSLQRTIKGGIVFLNCLLFSNDSFKYEEMCTVTSCRGKGRHYVLEIHAESLSTIILIHIY